EPHPRRVVRLVGGELRGRARGRRSLGEARRDAGEDSEDRAPSRVSRRDRRSPPPVPELGEVVKDEDTEESIKPTGAAASWTGARSGYSPFAPTSPLPGASPSPLPLCNDAANRGARQRLHSAGGIPAPDRAVPDRAQHDDHDDASRDHHD